MLVLAGVGALVLAIIVLGEWADARFQQRHGGTRPLWRAAGPALPEPLIPSTIQRNANNG